MHERSRHGADSQAIACADALRDDFANLVFKSLEVPEWSGVNLQMTMSVVEMTTAQRPPPRTESKKIGRDSLTVESQGDFHGRWQKRTDHVGEQQDHEDPMPAF